MRARARCLLAVLMLVLPLWPWPAARADSLAAVRQAQQAADAAHRRASAACAQRFFVNDCLRHADTRWRRAQAALRLRQVKLQRAQRAAAAPSPPP